MKGEKHNRDVFPGLIPGQCSVCQNAFGYRDILVVEQKNNRVVCHGVCNRCQSAFLTFLFKNQAGIVNVGMMTDLGRQEVKEVFNREAINSDEIIDIHQWLSGGRGNLNNLFLNNSQ